MLFFSTFSEPNNFRNRHQKKLKKLIKLKIIKNANLCQFFPSSSKNSKNRYRNLAKMKNQTLRIIKVLNFSFMPIEQRLVLGFYLYFKGTYSMSCNTIPYSVVIITIFFAFLYIIFIYLEETTRAEGPRFAR